MRGYVQIYFRTLQCDTITYFYFVHHHVGVEMFQIRVVHEVVFGEFFKMRHIPCVGDHHKIIGAGHIVALRHFLALLHRFLEFINGFGSSFVQNDVNHTGNANPGGGWGDDRNVCLNDLFIPQPRDPSLHRTLAQVDDPAELFCRESVVLLQLAKQHFVVFIQCLHKLPGWVLRIG